MTALLTLERSRPSTVYRAVRYHALPAESQIELQPGEKMTVADLLRGMLIESANDAAATLATRIGGTEANFVRAMNKRAKQLGLKNTHYANPIGLDDPANYSTARDLVRLTLRARAFNFFRRTVAHEQVTLHSGNHERTLENRNGLVKLQQVNGVKTGHTQQAGYVLVGSGRQQRDHADLGRAGGAERRRARGRHAQALRLGVQALPPRAPDLARTRCSPARRSATAAAPSSTSWRGPRGGASWSAAAGTCASCGLRVPDEVAGPIASGDKLGEVDVCRGKEKLATLPVVAAADVPGRRPRRPHQGSLHEPLDPAPGPVRRAGRYGWSQPAPPAVLQRPSWLARGAGGSMIITVTLNTAIDKTLAVPNFRLGRRHRTVEQTEMPGGKGVNVARVLKTLGQPVIATGLAGGATGTRIVEQLTQLSVLSDFVRIREESRTNTAVIDPTTGEQTEINERGPRVTEQEIELFTDKLLYLAQGASVCVFAGSLPREVDVDVYARLIRELKRLGRRLRGRHRRRPAAARGARGARRDLAERARGRGARRPRVQRRGGPVHRRARDGRPRRAGGGHDRARRLLRADGARGAGRAQRELYRVRMAAGSVEPRATVGSGDAFLAGFVASRYLGRSQLDCLAYGVACGAESTQHLGAGLVDPEQVGRLRSEIEVERPRTLGPFSALHNAGRRLAWTVHLPSAAKPRIPSWK